MRRQSDIYRKGFHARIIGTFHADSLCINSSAPGQNGRHYADDIFKCIFMNEIFCISIRIPLTSLLECIIKLRRAISNGAHVINFSSSQRKRNTA